VVDLRGITTSVDMLKSWSSTGWPRPNTQRRPPDAVPRASGVRRAAPYRDVLPDLPGALARHPH
jgi:hypothetical protein